MPPSTQQQDSRAPQTGAHSDATMASKSRASSAFTFTIPPSLKRIFDRFPLFTYPENSLPLSSPQIRNPQFTMENVLYIWSTDEQAAAGKPSFNPTCLQAQTYLKFQQVPFVLQSANNHASSTGSLPYIIPRRRWLLELPIRNAALAEWARNHSEVAISERQTGKRADAEAIDPIHDILAAQIRPAYLNALYLNERTFSEVIFPRYIAPASSNELVRFDLSVEVRNAAYNEFAASSFIIRLGGHDLTSTAANGLHLLASRLGQREWFSSQGADSPASQDKPVPGMLDAAVFAYTHTIVSLFAGQHEHSSATALLEEVLRHQNLVQHHQRILERYYV